MEKFFFNKKILRFIYLILIVLISCNKENEEEIVGNTNKLNISNLNVTEQSYVKIKANVVINNLYRNKINEIGFCWNVEPNPDTSRFVTIISNYSSDYISTEILDLEPNTTYYLKVYARIGSVIIYSDKEVEFHTLPIDIPKVITKEITNITTYSCQSGGDIYDSRGGAISKCGVCWNITGKPTIEDCIIQDTTGKSIFVSELTNLTHNTEYFVRAYAINQAGVGYGAELSFFTKDGAPDMEIKEFPEVLTKTVKVKVIINDFGELDVIENGVCWNTSGSPLINNNITTTFTNHEVLSSGAVSYEYLIEGLNINTQYFIRPFLKNGAGVHYGTETNFNTLDGVIEISTVEISDITTSGAKSGGVILNDEGLDIIEKGVCWNTSGSPTINNPRSLDGIGESNFSSKIVGLLSNTKYYTRAYIVNEVGVSYGNEIEFVSNDGSPVIQTSVIREIMYNSCISGGNIVTDEGSSIIEKGVCWNTTGNPTTNDSKTNDGSGLGNYSSFISNLSEGETYYIRAYAVNSFGIGYGDVLSVKLIYGVIQVKDYDGNLYNTLKIGNQIWLKENLRTTHYPDGISINHGDGSLNMGETPEYYFDYADNIANSEVYGRLYTWYAGNRACPTGWHMPTKNEWDILFGFVGVGYEGKLKSKGTIEEGNGLWKSPNNGANNEFGFSILPTGQRTDSQYAGINETVNYQYRNSIFNEIHALGFINLSSICTVHASYNLYRTASPVRCIKD